jgi:peptidoglycan/LPS O-acetylase OafA/YrhL
MPSLTYRPEIDGLRAVAVISVVLFHLDPDLFPGGFLGVDVFFVISGFLITSIIRSELAAGTFSLGAFWERRIRRLMPAALVLLASVLLAALFLGMPQYPLALIGRQVAAALLLVANIAMRVLASDYWAPEADRLALLHHWSLSVEEQFYIAFPLIVSALALHRRPRLSFILLAAGCILGMAAWWQALSTDPSASFYLLHYRAWELLLGCALAFSPNWAPRRIALLPLLILIFVLFTPTIPRGFLGYAQILAVVSTGAFLMLAHSSSGAGFLLSAPPSLALGKASYSLYLWHWPCIVLARIMAGLLEAPWVEWFSLPAMAIGTFVSFRHVEPFGRRCRRPFLLAVSSAGVLLAASAWAAFNTREPHVPGVSKPTLMDVSYDCVRRPPPRFFGDSRIGFRQVNDKFNAPTKELYLDGIVCGQVGSPRIWMLMGDSHGLMWADTVDDLASAAAAELRVYAAIGVPPLLIEGPCSSFTAVRREAYNRARLDTIQRERPEWVILTMRWDAAFRSGLMPRVGELIDSILVRSPSTKVLVLGQPPVAAVPVNVPQWADWRSRWGLPFDTAPLSDSSDAADAEGLVRQAAGERAAASYCDISGAFLRDGRVTVVKSGQILYRDTNHLTHEGARHAAPLLRRALGAVQR